MLYVKESTITLDEVQLALRTKELTNFKDLKLENGVEALNVSTGKDGGRGERAKTKSKGGDLWKSSHCEKIGHFKMDCLELKDNDDSMHVGEGSSDEDCENAEALVVLGTRGELGYGL
jgi:hypothetical protein